MLRGLYDPPYPFRRPDLGDGHVSGRRKRAPRPRTDPPCRLPQRRLHRPQVDIAIGGLHGDGLERGDREPELLPLARVRARHREHPLTEAERQRARPGGQQLAQPLPGPVRVDDIPGGDPRGLQSQLAEPFPGRGDLLTEDDPLVDPGYQREDGPAAARVRGYDGEVGVLRPRNRRLHPVQHPRVTVPPCGHGEFGRVVPGPPVRRDGQHDLAPARPPEQLRLQLLAAVRLYGHRRGTALQQRHPRQHLRRLAQHQTQRDRVQARPAVLRGERQAQQVRVGEPCPQRPVEVVGDGARGDRGAGHRVRRDPAEHRLRRLDRRLLLLGEGEVHGPVLPRTDHRPGGHRI